MYGTHVNAYAKINTDCRCLMANASSSSDPIRLNHQNELGTTTSFFFSVAHHCTTNREKKTRFPVQPITFQVFHSMPSKRPSKNTTSKCAFIRALNPPRLRADNEIKA